MFDSFFDPNDKAKIGKYTLVVLVLLAVFLGVKSLNGLKEYTYIGKNIPPMNVISVTGSAEVFLKPDVATFTYTVMEEGKTTTEAQDKATKKNNAVVDALKKAGIEEKDIKTSAYNVYPKYDYINARCLQDICPPSRSVISGYEVSQSIEVKVRAIDKAGDILALVGSNNVSNVSGLNFVIDDMDAAKAEVRNKAIADAKEKAKALSKELGVRFDRIINFSEGGDYGYPYLSARSEAMGVATMDSKISPQVPTGENKITSQVTLTYSIN